MLTVLTFRTPDEAVEKANNTPYGLAAACGPRRARASSRWPNSCGRVSSGRTPTTASTPLRPSVAASRASAARVGATGSRRTWSSIEQAPRAEDVQALHRRRVSAVRSRAARTRLTARTSPEDRGRTCAMRFAPRARPSQVGGADGRTTEGRWSTGSPRCSSPQVGVRRPLYGARRGGALDRPSRLVRGLGRQAATGARLVEPRCRPLLQLHGA